MNKSNPTPINRRKFIATTGMGVALFNILPGGLMTGTRSLNDKLNVARICMRSLGGADGGGVSGWGHFIVSVCNGDENYATTEFAK